MAEHITPPLVYYWGFIKLIIAFATTITTQGHTAYNTQSAELNFIFYEQYIV